MTATADNLFGDASDISSDEGAEPPPKPEDVEGAEDREKQPVIGEDGEEEEVEIPETRIEVEIPKIKTNLGRNLHFVKLPNFLSVETRPFDPMTYEDEIDEDEMLDEEGRTRMKLKVENTIRWKTLKDEEGTEMKDEFGQPLRVSNARVVRWSDGSLSLHLGGEVFDIHTMLLQGDYNHLFVRQGTGLQGQAVFKTKLTFRPHSTDSFTHRKMTMSLADRSKKTQTIRVLPMVGKDPDAHRNEMIKKEEERLKASIRRESQQRRMKERAHHRGMDRAYLEDEEDDEDGPSIAALKEKYKQRGQQKEPRPSAQIYSSSDEDSFDEEREVRAQKRLTKAKQLHDSDDEESGGDDDDEPVKKIARIEESEDEED